jgi:isohexenylglutaconyl-CoA hydratase
MLTAARFKGEEAGALGVLDFVASNTEELEALEQRVKQDVLECAPGAVAACKALIIGMPATPDEQKVEFAAMNFSGCLQGDEGKEGVASFIEKRKPNWHTEI